MTVSDSDPIDDPEMPEGDDERDDERDDVGPRSIAPMFPLPNQVLFPRTILPLHIFEPRYREMVEDLLDRSGRLVLGNLRNESDACDADDNSSEVYPIAGLGEILRHQRLDDGRFLIWLVGIGRVRIEEVASDRLYRQVRCECVDECDIPDDDEAAGLRERLCEAIRTRVKRGELPADKLPIGRLADVLVQCMSMTSKLSPVTTQELYGELSVVKRAEAALAHHDRIPVRKNDLGGTEIPDYLPESFD